MQWEGNMTQPLISVIMPAHNCDRYLAQAIDSILAQDYPNIELVVVDDHSVDRTYAVAWEYATRDPRVRVFKGTARGAAAARNLALANVSGEFVANLDGDDVCTPTRLRRQWQECSKHEHAVVGSYVEMVREDLSAAWIISFPTDDTSIRHRFRRRVNRLAMMPGTIMAHKTIFDRLPYHEGILILSDWDFILRAAEQDDIVFVNIPEQMYKYRVNANSLTMTGHKRNQYNLMVWHNEKCRRRKRREAVDLTEFLGRVSDNPVMLVWYWVMIGVKTIQHRRWRARTRRQLGFR